MKAKYLVTCVGVDRKIITMEETSLARAKAVWRGAENKQIWKLVKK